MTEKLNWDLNEGEELLWQGRPAPRCYTFRHWLQALIGTVIFLASSFWLMVGVQLIKAQGYSWWLLPVPLMLVLGSFLVGPGQLIFARIKWEKIFYALTDQRLLVRQRMFGRKMTSYDMGEYKHYKSRKYGQRLLSLKLSFHHKAPVVLECLEHPDPLLKFLDRERTT